MQGILSSGSELTWKKNLALLTSSDHAPDAETGEFDGLQVKRISAVAEAHCSDKRAYLCWLLRRLEADWTLDTFLSCFESQALSALT